jgi:DNA-directed RNA polymerase, sigma subunit (sigma70/sigma32)
VHLADDAHHTSLYLQTEIAKNTRSQKRRLQLQNKIRELEKSLWFSLPEYAEEYRTLKSWLRQAFKAKTEMVEANLRLVISIDEKIYQSRSVVSRSDPGRTWVNEGSREIRIPAGATSFPLTPRGGFARPSPAPLRTRRVRFEFRCT